MDRLDGLKGNPPKAKASTPGGTAVAGKALSEKGKPLPEGEEGAKTLFREARRHARKLEIDDALLRLAMLRTHFPDTDTTKRANRLTRDLGVVGTKVETLDVKTWFQGEGDKVDLGSGVTMVIFSDVADGDPEAQIKRVLDLVNQQSGKVSVVTLVRGKSSVSETQAKSFVATLGLKSPVGELTNEAKETFQVRGMPAAALVKAGAVAWRGMLTELDENLLELLL
jgi:hypothetical protein